MESHCVKTSWSAPGPDLGGWCQSPHVDAPTPEETDWVQIVEWYGGLMRLTVSQVVCLSRAGLGGARGAGRLTA
jgi:predicted RNA polymerase sigma factor